MRAHAPEDVESIRERGRGRERKRETERAGGGGEVFSLFQFPEPQIFLAGTNITNKGKLLGKDKPLSEKSP